MTDLQQLLLKWYRHSNRDLPWRATRDPYRILLSEVMLQQTRVETVLPYYHAFLKRFPDAAALAAAPEAEVLAMWSGLGYYSRARNLQRAARAIMEAGSFPSDYEGIRDLPGVGEYTAAAVASIAFELPYAAVDGNVLRVIARLVNDSGDISSPVTRRRFQQLAQENLDARHPGDFNQAMMELGATTCTPKKPRCLLCPVRSVCGALAAGRVGELPIKLKRAESRREEISVVAVLRGDEVLLRQRGAKASRMADFWELPHLEDVPKVRNVATCGSFRHTIVNTLFEVHVYTGSVRHAPAGMEWRRRAACDIPMTTITRKSLSRVEDKLHALIRLKPSVPGMDSGTQSA